MVNLFEFFPFSSITKSEQKVLLAHARQCIEAEFEKVNAVQIENPSPRLCQERGAFVTLIKDHDLRGCIGFAQSTQPLYQTVCEMAVAAAFKDPRFPPLEEQELPRTIIEISVLSRMREVSSIKRIKIRRHGLMIKVNDTKALLLPQVAERNSWDRLTFLENVCMKAGLERDDWKKPDAEILVFSAQVFKEKPLNLSTSSEE